MLALAEFVLDTNVFTGLCCLLLVSRFDNCGGGIMDKPDLLLEFCFLCFSIFSAADYGCGYLERAAP